MSKYLIERINADGSKSSISTNNANLALAWVNESGVTISRLVSKTLTESDLRADVREQAGPLMFHLDAEPEPSGYHS